MKTFILSESTVNSILSYLGGRPWTESNDLIQKLGAEIKNQSQPMPVDKAPADMQVEPTDAD